MTEPSSPRGQPRAPRTTAEVAERRGFRLRGRSVRQHVARGVLINAAFMIGLNTLSLLRGFMIAVFLTREDYGIWGIVIVTFGTLLMLKDVGVGDKFIQQDDDDQELAFQKAFTVELIFTGAFMLLLPCLLPLIVVVYGEPKLLAPGLVVLATLPAGILALPVIAYVRRMDFVKARTLLAIDPVVSLLVSIGLAAAGAGYWSLIIGLVAGAWATGLACLVASPYKLRLRFDREALRAYTSFSWPLFVNSFAALVVAQTAILSTNAVLGLAATGAFTLAVTITQFTERVDALVTGTLYPAVCAVSDRTELLYESFVKSNRLALMWAMPFGIALTLFSPDLVRFVIGEEWRPAVIVLQIFGVAAALNHLGFNWTAYFRATGRTRPIAVANVAAMLSFVATVLPLLNSAGMTGLAIAVGIQGLVHLAVRTYFLKRLFEGFALLPHAARAMAPTLPAALIVLLVRQLESGHRTGAVAAGELLLFGAVVVAVTLALERPLLRELFGYLRGRSALGAAT